VGGASNQELSRREEKEMSNFYKYRLYIFSCSYTSFVAPSTTEKTDAAASRGGCKEVDGSDFERVGEAARPEREGKPGQSQDAHGSKPSRLQMIA
jgi:hypothetical protein